jgi:sugar transferase (PEP-CTERM/EpsH1 system associated)
MHVLLLTHRLPYAPNRGDRIRAFHLLRELSKFATVSLFSLVHDAEEATHVEEVPYVTRVATGRVPRFRNLVRGLLSLPTSRPLTHSLLDAPGVRATLEDMIRTHPPDVVLAYCSGMARFAMAPPLDRVPCVLDMVDVDSGKWADLAGRSALPRRWVYRREALTLGAFEARAARHARTTFVVNDRERALMLALAPGAVVHVVPNGVDVEGFMPPDPPQASARVVFCGVMNYEPNVQGVIWFAQQVWPRVRATRRDARFTIVGADPAPAVLALATRDSSIDVTGRVPEVQRYLWQAAVAVAPLQVSRGLQNKVLEAVAAGLPAVVTGAVEEGLPPSVRSACVVADEPEAFADAVLGLLELSPKDRRQKAGEAAIADVSWRDQLAPLEAILRTAVRSSA